MMQDAGKKTSQLFDQDDQESESDAEQVYYNEVRMASVQRIEEQPNNKNSLIQEPLKKKATEINLDKKICKEVFALHDFKLSKQNFMHYFAQFTKDYGTAEVEQFIMRKVEDSNFSHLGKVELNLKRNPESIKQSQNLALINNKRQIKQSLDNLDLVKEQGINEMRERLEDAKSIVIWLLILMIAYLLMDKIHREYEQSIGKLHHDQTPISVTRLNFTSPHFSQSCSNYSLLLLQKKSFETLSLSCESELKEQKRQTLSWKRKIIDTYKISKESAIIRANLIKHRKKQQDVIEALRGRLKSHCWLYIEAQSPTLS